MSWQYGVGGWWFDDQILYYFLEPWPPALGCALRERPRRWVISHGELLAEVMAVVTGLAEVPMDVAAETVDLASSSDLLRAVSIF